jgi:hypothetical protein
MGRLSRVRGSCDAVWIDGQNAPTRREIRNIKLFEVDLAIEPGQREVSGFVPAVGSATLPLDRVATLRRCDPSVRIADDVAGLAQILDDGLQARRNRADRPCCE